MDADDVTKKNLGRGARFLNRPVVPPETGRGFGAVLRRIPGPLKWAALAYPLWEFLKFTRDAGTETGYFAKDAQDERSARRASGDNLLGVVHSNPAQAQAERSAHTEGVDLLAPPPVPPASAGVDLLAAQPVQLLPDGVDLFSAPAASKPAPRTKVRYWGPPDSSEAAPEATPENTVVPPSGTGFVRNNTTGTTTYIGPRKRK